MNILHLCDTPLSGSPYRLMKIQQKAGHNSRLINARVKYSEHSGIEYPKDILLQVDKRTKYPIFDKDEIFYLFENADVIHCHNRYRDQFIFRYYPELTNFLFAKRTVLQFHSNRYSLKKANVNIKDHTLDVSLVVAQYQVRHFPESIPVPNAIDIYDPIYMPTKNRSSKHIVYSPSNTVLKGWNNKGHQFIEKSLRLFKQKATYDIITNTPHLECIKRKQQGSIVIDEIMTGSYHLCTLEGLSHGQVVFCNLDDRTIDAVSEVSNSPLPVINSDKKNFKTLLNELLEDEEKISELGKKSRNFMEENWNPDIINKKYEEAYKV